MKAIYECIVCIAHAACLRHSFISSSNVSQISCPSSNFRDIREAFLLLLCLSWSYLTSAKIRSSLGKSDIAEERVVNGPPNLIQQSKHIFYKQTIKVCDSCSWWCPGTFAPSPLNLTLYLILFSSRRNARDGVEVVAGRNRTKKYFLNKGVIDLPPR